MNIYQLAAQELRKGADLYRKNLELADTLSDVGALEKAAEDAQERLKFIEGKVAAEETRLSGINAEANETREKAVKLLSDAQAAVEQRLADVAEKAKSTLADTASKVAKMVEDATAKKDAADAECGRLRAEAATLTAEVNAKGVALQALKNEMDSLKKKLG